jgi:hypothetical protein
MIGATKPQSKKRQREEALIGAAFAAISNAMGWDRQYPRHELYSAVQLRLDPNLNPDARRKLIQVADAQLAMKLNPDPEEGI